MLRTEVHWVSGIEPHRLAVMPRPRGGEALADEVAGWRSAAIDVVVSLLEPHEIGVLELRAEPELCREQGIEFVHFPIADFDVPTSEDHLVELLTALRGRLLQGRSIAIHCRAGIGRTGLVAGCLLHLLGVPRGEIFHLLSRSRGVAMPHTSAQAAWVERFTRSVPAGG